MKILAWLGANVCSAGSLSIREANKMKCVQAANDTCMRTGLSYIRCSSLFLCYKLQSLVSQAVQILYFLAIDAGRALYQQGRCRHKQFELSMSYSTVVDTAVRTAVNTLSKIEVRASLERKGNTFQHVLRIHAPSVKATHVKLLRNLSSHLQRVSDGCKNQPNSLLTRLLC